MYSFDNLSFSLGYISSVLALPVFRGRHGKLVDNFIHESEVTFLQDPFTSRPYKTRKYRGVHMFRYKYAGIRRIKTQMDLEKEDMYMNRVIRTSIGTFV